MTGFRINTNIPAIFSQRQLTIVNWDLQKNMEKLSSGYRINRARDDAAGMAIAEQMQTQMNGLRQAAQNIQDGISLVQVAEGGIDQITNHLQRLRTLSVQAANDTLTTTDRALVQLEFNQLLQEINRQVSTCKFNTKKLLNGNYSEVANSDPAREAQRTSLVLQVGANNGMATSMNGAGAETISFFLFTVNTAGLGVDGLAIGGTRTQTVSLVSSIISNAYSGTGSQGVVSRRGAESAINLLDKAIVSVNGLRAEIGAIQNRLEKTYAFVQLQNENQTAAHSRIKDLDFSGEIVDFTKNQILLQTGTSALAQANVAPQSVLQLLR